MDSKAHKDRGVKNQIEMFALESRARETKSSDHLNETDANGDGESPSLKTITAGKAFLHQTTSALFTESIAVLRS